MIPQQMHISLKDERIRLEHNERDRLLAEIRRHDDHKDPTYMAMAARVLANYGGETT